MKKIISISSLVILGISASAYASEQKKISTISIVQDINDGKINLETNNPNPKGYTFKIISDNKGFINTNTLELVSGKSDISITQNDLLSSPNKEKADVSINVLDNEKETKYTINNDTDDIVLYRVQNHNDDKSISYKETTIRPHMKGTSTFIKKNEIDESNSSSIAQSWANPASGYVNQLIEFGGGGKYTIGNTSSGWISPTTELYIFDEKGDSCKAGTINLPIEPNSRKVGTYECLAPAQFAARGYFPFKSEMRITNTPGTYDKYAVDPGKIHVM